MAILWIGNDNLIRLLDLVDLSGGNEATPSEVKTATVTAQIKTITGVAVGSSITLNYITSTDADYEGIAADTLPLTDGTRYIVEITADDGADRRGFWRLITNAKYRDLS